ncbi:MAG: RND family transporter [Lachnospiraceae bacterium]
MEKLYSMVIRMRKAIMVVFFIVAGVCMYFSRFVSVNYDMNSYLPDDAPSTTALHVMEEEFDGAIPNARVLVKDVNKKQALDYKKKLEAVEGVLSVMWVDDALPTDLPLEAYDKETLEAYYKNGAALFTVTIKEEAINSAVPAIRKVIGTKNAMSGSAVSTAVATESTVSEIRKMTIIAVLFLLIVLTITTNSWVEPFVVLLGLGIAVVINSGSNLIFGEISFVTNAAGTILQLAVSLDYSVFLIHRFAECRKEAKPKEAMKEALVCSTSSILSSGLTTVIGFLALVMMRFKIGPDLGLALAKGIAISLLTVFFFMPGLILATYRWMDRTEHKAFLPSFRRFGKVIRKVMIPCMCVFLALIIPSYIASIKNEYYYGSSHIFDVGTKLGDDTKQIQDIFGKNDTYVLMVPKGDEKTERELTEKLNAMDKITSITSLSNILGPSVPTSILPDSLRKQLESEQYHRMVLSVAVDYEGEETIALVEKIRKTAQEYYPDSYYLAGEGVSTYDLMDTVTADMIKVNLLAIGAVFLVLLFTMRSISLPIMLVLTIETAIWLNLSVPYLMKQPLFYIAYLIISSIQLGATVDYAILLTERYKENRETLDKKTCIVETISNVTASILTSGMVLMVVGFLLGVISTHGLLSQLGYLIGRGTICSLIAVLFVLPGFLYVLDRTFIKKK